MLSHNLIARRLAALALLAVDLTLAACAGTATPQLIGSYPSNPESGVDLPDYVAPPANLLVVYSAYMELEVADVEAAADRAVRLAYDYGGYLASSQTWRRDGELFATLTLAVPVAQFDRVRDGLLQLGTLESESVSGDLVRTGRYEDEWNTYTHITVQLRPVPSAFSLPSIPGTGWNPFRTLQRAFGVVFAIFQVLADIAIWIIVVVGPFMLLGWGAWRLARRIRRRRIL